MKLTTLSVFLFYRVFKNVKVYEHNSKKVSGLLTKIFFVRKIQKEETPVLVIELDGKEHFDDEIVKDR